MNLSLTKNPDTSKIENREFRLLTPPQITSATLKSRKKMPVFIIFYFLPGWQGIQN